MNSLSAEATAIAKAIDHADKRIPRRSGNKQNCRAIAGALFLAFALGTSLVENSRNIAFNTADTRAARSLRRTVPTDSSRHATNTLTPIDAVATLGQQAASWPPTTLLDDLFRDTPISQRRLVVAAANADYVDFADNFASSLLSVNVSNFVLVPLDGIAYQVLHDTYPAHTLPLMPGIDPNNLLHASGFGSKEFKQLTSFRPLFLRWILETGYPILYNDIDMVWIQNAWESLDELAKDDTDMMLWHDGPGSICSCMLYLRPTKESFLLLTRWQEEIATNLHKNDQPALNKVAKDLGFSAKKQTNATAVYRNSPQFPSGHQYFGKRGQPPSEETVKKRIHAIIVHNNWISGKQHKLDRFRAVGLWNPSGKLPVTSV